MIPIVKRIGEIKLNYRPCPFQMYFFFKHVLLPCIVHRNNPADDPALTGGGAGQPGAVANLFSGFSSSTR